MDQIVTLLVATLANSDVARNTTDRIIMAYSYLHVIGDFCPERLSPLEREVMTFWKHVEHEEAEQFKQYRRDFLAWIDNGQYVGPENPLNV